MDQRADTLLAYLQKVGDMGFNPKHFYVKNIETDLQRLRDLQLGEGTEDANHVLARLEYRLTKSYLRYVGGQRFGYVNPTFVLNRLDSIAPNPYDSIKRPVRFRGLYDVKIDHASDHFYHLALQQIVKSGRSNDGEEAEEGDDRQSGVVSPLSAFLRDVQPKAAFYEQLKAKLQAPGLGKAMRTKIWNVAVGDRRIVRRSIRSMCWSISRLTISSPSTIRIPFPCASAADQPRPRHHCLPAISSGWT